MSRKPRTIRAHELHTGDVVMPPSATTQSTVTQVRIHRDTVHVTYAHGTAEMHQRTPVRIYRSSKRTVNHDTTAPAVVFSSASPQQ